MKIILSIIIYVKNNKKHIEKCLESVNYKDKKHIELIVIDGKSTDGTSSIIKNYKFLLDYYISEQDKCASEAMNKGARLASGDFIAFLASDDEYIPDSLHKILEFLKLYKSYDILNFNTIIEFADKTRKKYKRVSEQSASEIIEKPFTNSRIYKRKSFIDLGCFKIAYEASDLLFLLEAFSKNVKMINCDFVFYKYQSHENSKTLSFSTKNLLELKFNLIKIFNYLIKSDVGKILKIIIIYYYARSILKIFLLYMNIFIRFSLKFK